MKTLRIFISSPGDVDVEREKARQVIALLQRDYAEQVLLKPVLWEDLPLGADASFQQGIDLVLSKDQGIDIAVFILWSRLGSPLGTSVTKPDGSHYRSGTEREFDLMLEALKQSADGRPFLLAYVRKDDDGFKRRLLKLSPEKLPEEVNQQRLARQFIEECFRDAETKTNLRAYHSYPEPVTFAGRLRQHLRELIEVRLGDAALAAPRWDGNPYRAFDVFDLEHADIFQGRDGAVADLEALLRRRTDLPFVVVVGGSGSGKSSLVRAGLAASLVRFNLDETVSRWLTASLIPGECDGRLLHGLARELCDVLPGLRDRHLTPEILAGRLAQPEPDIADLTLAFQQPGEEKVKVLLLIDQLEELHTDHRLSPEQRDGFYRALHALARSRRFWIAATLRSDFYALAQRDPGFLSLKGGDGQFDLLPPEPSALRRMITEPARLAGLTFERDERSDRSLDQLLLDDATSQPDALPLLEFTLHELYLRRQGRLITLSSYCNDLGTLAGAVGKRADNVFQALPIAAQDALPGLLQKLITLDPGTEFTAVRRRAAFDPADTDSPEGQLVQALTRARLLSAGRTGGQSTLSLSHEALLTSWKIVADWIERNHGYLRLRTGVEQSTARWESSRQDPSLLLPPGLPLEEGRKVLHEAAHLLDEKTSLYVETSIAHHESEVRRRARQRRNVVAGLSAITLLALLAAGWGWVSQKKAETAEAEAEDARSKTAQQLQETTRQLERSQLEEGRTWIERAKSAKNQRDHLGALMLAGRAVGFRGYGRSATETAEWEQQFPQLLAAPMSDPSSEQGRQTELEELEKFIANLSPTALPVWVGRMAAPVRCVAFSPDGTRIASGSEILRVRKTLPMRETTKTPPMPDNTPGVPVLEVPKDAAEVRVWDAVSGKELFNLIGHEAPVVSLSFNADGTRLVSGSSDNTIKLWDTSNGLELASFSASIPELTRTLGFELVSLALSPDGSRLATLSNGFTGPSGIMLRDMPSGKLLFRMSNEARSEAFSPDGIRLACGPSLGNDSGGIQLLDVTSGKELVSINTGNTKTVQFSPDGTRVASVTPGGTIKLWDVATAKELIRITSGSTEAVRFSPDGNRLASWSGFGVRLWDVATGENLVSFRGHTEELVSLDFSPDGTRLVTGAEDNSIKLWDIASNRELVSLCGHSLNVARVVFSRDGTRIASCASDPVTGGEIKLWDAVTGIELGSLSGHSDSVLDVAFSPDGSRIATGAGTLAPGGEAKLWDAATGKELGRFPGHNAGVVCVAFNPDGTLLACGSASLLPVGGIKLWDLATGKERFSVDQKGSVTGVAFSPDGSRLLSRTQISTFTVTGPAVVSEIKLWDVSSGKELGLPDGPELARVEQWLLDQEHPLSSDRKSTAVTIGKLIRIIPAEIPAPDLAVRLRAGLLALPGREVEFPEPTGPTPMIPVRDDLYSQLADPDLTPARRAELRMLMCAKSRQYRAATAQWRHLLIDPANTPGADSEIRRIYLLALIDAAKHPAIHGHAAVREIASEIASALTSEQISEPTISLAMMSLMQTLLDDESPEMVESRTALMDRLKETAPKEWLDGL